MIVKGDCCGRGERGGGRQASMKEVHMFENGIVRALKTLKQGRKDIG
jgi:hypothetical protein